MDGTTSIIGTTVKKQHLQIVLVTLGLDICSKSPRPPGGADMLYCSAVVAGCDLQKKSPAERQEEENDRARKKKTQINAGIFSQFRLSLLDCRYVGLNDRFAMQKLYCGCYFMVSNASC